ncbi:MAG: ABC transporter permease [Lachnospiraceae bacterium]
MKQFLSVSAFSETEKKSMEKWLYLLRRFGEGVFIVFCIITVNFFLIRFMPGDPVRHILGEDEYFNLMSMDPDKIEEVRADYGLDKSYPEQYLAYLNKTIHLDFGNSYRTKNTVLSTIVFRAKWTMWLAIPTILISGILGAVSGLYCGRNQGGKVDGFFTTAGLVISTIPTNCLAILFLILFAFKGGWFPISGITKGGCVGLEKIFDIFRHMQLPLIIMILYRTASNHLLMRSTAIQVNEGEYIGTAVSKGMTERRVRLCHMLKNTLCPYVTSLCMQFGNILTGAMMVEIVFSWKGMGTLIYDSVTTKDFPMLQGCFLFIGVCVVVFNFLADLICTMIDPRIKGGAGREV